MAVACGRIYVVAVGPIALDMNALNTYFQSTGGGISMLPYHGKVRVKSQHLNDLYHLKWR